MKNMFNIEINNHDDIIWNKKNIKFTEIAKEILQ
jgi:hypothetical protein